MKIGRRFAIEMDGWPETLARLNALPPAVEGQVLVAALDAAGEPLLATIDARVPRRTGDLANHLAMETVEADRTHALVDVGVFGDFTAPFVEYGHQAVTHAGVNVGHVPAHPFVRPAWDANKATMPDIIGDELLGAIDQAWEQTA